MERRETRGFAVSKGDDRLELAVPAEAIPQQIRLGGDDRVRRALEGGKRADHSEKQGAVIRGRETDLDLRRHRAGRRQVPLPWEGSCWRIKAATLG